VGDQRFDLPRTGQKAKAAPDNTGGSAALLPSLNWLMITLQDHLNQFQESLLVLVQDICINEFNRLIERQTQQIL
jgi:hypothetical protein